VRESGLTQFSQNVQTIGFSAFVALFASLMAAVLVAPHRSLLARVFQHPVLMFFGRYAYGLYIVHLLVLFELALRFHRADWLRTAAGSQIPMNLIFSATCTAVAVGIAWASWHVYEKQFLKLKKYVPYGRPRHAAGRPRADEPTPPESVTIPAP
jgi:peptidoglycan/LPS O-acetylase OafA/YrhL